MAAASDLLSLSLTPPTIYLFVVSIGYLLPYMTFHFLYKSFLQPYMY